MLELLSGFDWLGEQFPTTNQRIAVTVAAVAFFVYVLLIYRRLQERLVDRLRPVYVDVLALGLLVGTGVLTAAVVVGVWEQTAEVRRLYAEIGLGGADVARIVLSLVFVLSALILTRLVRRGIRELLSSSPAVTDHQRQVTYRLAQVGIWTVTFVVVLGLWIDDLSGLLVGAGLVGAAIGMAARQTIGSVIAGFVLMFARPFEIGDWIEVEDREGLVTDISIFNTQVRSFDGEYVEIPNDVIASSMVSNRSKRGRLRIEIDVGVDYRTDLDRAVTLLEETLEDLEEAASAPEPDVVSKGFGDSAVLLGARFWIDEPTARRRWRARTAAVRAIKEAFESEGIKIPFPQRELSGRAETGGFRVAGGNEAPPAEGEPRPAGNGPNPAGGPERGPGSGDDPRGDARVSTSEDG